MSAPLPLAGALHEELEQFALALRRRRSFPSRLYVGTPGGERIEVHPPTVIPDPGLRTDLVDRALEGLEDTSRPCLWITRPGELRATDSDLAWLAAAHDGFARHGIVPAGCFTFTRVGWLDLRTGHCVRFHRVRSRPG